MTFHRFSDDASVASQLVIPEIKKFLKEQRSEVMFFSYVYVFIPSSPPSCDFLAHETSVLWRVWNILYWQQRGFFTHLFPQLIWYQWDHSVIYMMFSLCCSLINGGFTLTLSNKNSLIIFSPPCLKSEGEVLVPKLRKHFQDQKWCSKPDIKL